MLALVSLLLAASAHAPTDLCAPFAAVSPAAQESARPEDSPRAQAAALYAKGESEARAGRAAEAARLFAEAIRLDPGHGDARAALGWARYRLGDFAGAGEAFGEAAAREPRRVDAWTGLGYARMQAADEAGAREAFAKARALAPADADVLKGTALLDLRTGKPAEAAALLRTVVEKLPQDEEARAALRRALAGSGALVDRRPRPTLLDARGTAPPDAPAPPLQVPFRAGAKYFERRSGDGWQPILVKGVNLGVALPGRFPSEFPEDEALYRDWLGRIRAMNANVVRLYTLLPPAFYSALAKENAAHPEAPVWLVQGVWVELPPGDDFSDPAWNADYAAELRRVIDVVHGNMDAAPRPGHASGLYDADASPWLLGFILGREWEPFSVRAYDEKEAKKSGGTPCAFDGRFVRVAAGSPTECWLASTLETAASYLADAYAESRPMAFTNWPTLDPLHHPTEATREEEDAILRARGVKEFPKRGPVYDNDAVALDEEHFAATERFPAGLFASYHVYPYYPDFLSLDPGYLAARDSAGPNAFAGYLEELQRRHAGRPLLISETGVPTSRGVAHRQPQGFDHGGHNEQEQAAIDARLVRAAQEKGCAGVIVFAWIDEWFKHNWLFWDRAIPQEHQPRWLNALDPEQNFGILAAVPGPEGGGIVLDGRVEDWAGIAPLYPPRKGKVRALYATSDEAWLYLRLDVEPRDRKPHGGNRSAQAAAAPVAAAPPGEESAAPPGRGDAAASGRGEAVPSGRGDAAASGRGEAAPPGGSAPAGTGEAAPAAPGGSAAPSKDGREGNLAGWTYWVGIDTYDRARGDTRLPGLEGKLRVPSGLEFAIRLDGAAPAILVDAPYDFGSHGLAGPYASVPNEDGLFVPMIVEIRLQRIGRDGTLFPAETHDMSPLRRGTTDVRSPRFDSLSDYFHDEAAGVFELRIPWALLNVTDPSERRVLHQTAPHPPVYDTVVTDGFVFYAAAVPPGKKRPAAERPAPGEEAPLFSWKTWETPRYHLRPKALYEALRRTYGDLGPLAAPPSAPVPPAP
jgi:Flp pilus assembly protein TadD